ncbi:MAG: hypothetical protein NXI24_14160 [bacterium]|nr:hypothetical protein [bacterium]
MTESTNTQHSAGQFFYRAIAALRALPSRIRPALENLTRWFRNYIGELSTRPATRFHTVLWAICIMFVGFFTLVGTNPFRLLIPDAFFHPPATDGREAVLIYGISIENQRPVKIQRRILLDGKPEQIVQRIAYAVSRPSDLQEGHGGAGYADLEPLPALGLAVRRVWFPTDGSHVLIDLREKSLNAELDRFLLNRTDGAGDRTALLDGYFRALTASLFELMPELKQIDYLLDGERQAVRGMQFRLDYRHGPSSGKPAATGGGG